MLADIYIRDIMTKIKILLFEGKAIPGALEVWLDPNGNGHYVRESHVSWALYYFKLYEPEYDSNIPDSRKNWMAYERKRIEVMRKLYDLGWVRVIVNPSQNNLYFDTFDTSWRKLSNKQKTWLYDMATHEYIISGNNVIPTKTSRHVALTVRFGNIGKELDLTDLFL